MSGTLYGIGVGPGDPELLTLKAHRLLTSAKVVAYPAPDSGESMARSIVASFLCEEQLEIPIIVPCPASGHIVCRPGPKWHIAVFICWYENNVFGPSLWRSRTIMDDSAD